MPCRHMPLLVLFWTWLVRVRYRMTAMRRCAEARVYGYLASWLLMVVLSASENGEVLLRGVGTLRYLLILSENSAYQRPVCAVAA